MPLNSYVDGYGNWYSEPVVKPTDDEAKTNKPAVQKTIVEYTENVKIPQFHRRLMGLYGVLLTGYQIEYNWGYELVEVEENTEDSSREDSNDGSSLDEPVVDDDLPGHVQNRIKEIERHRIEDPELARALGYDPY